MKSKRDTRHDLGKHFRDEAGASDKLTTNITAAIYADNITSALYPSLTCP